MSVYLRVTNLQANLFAARFAKVKDATIRRRVLRIFGQELRRKMRRSIKTARRRRDGTYRRSRPGGFPFARTRPGVSKASNKFVGGKFLIYQYDASTESVVVGPRKWRSNPAGKPMPETLEFGGTTIWTPARAKRMKVRKIGDGGEIRIGGRFGDRNAAGRVRRSGMKVVKDTNLGNVPVAYGKLKTAAQVRRANRIQARLFGRGLMGSIGSVQIKRRKRVAARPYARPTLKWFVGSTIPNDVLTRVLAKAAQEGGRGMRRR